MTGHNAGKPFKPIIRNVYSHLLYNIINGIGLAVRVSSIVG